jgi:sphingomyelin phosphodiesterase
MRIRQLVLASVLVISGTAGFTGAPSADAAVSARIASHNVFMLSQLIPPAWGQNTRADLIASEGVLAGQDVVVLQEAFDNDASTRLLANLAPAYPHQTPVLGRSASGWNASSGPFLWQWRVEDGGVAIASRWPITYRSQRIFASGCGVDAASAKGFAYARVDAPGASDLHVVGTHLQADDSLCSSGQAVTVRAAQLREIGSFLRSAGIPATDTVVVAGDLNVDRAGPEYAPMLATLGAAAPDAYTGHSFSFEPSTNSIAADRYPGSAPQYLDYVLLVNGFARPAGRWINEARAVHSAPWTVTQYFETNTFTDHSDHYPVFARVT